MLVITTLKFMTDKNKHRTIDVNLLSKNGFVYIFILSLNEFLKEYSNVNSRTTKKNSKANDVKSKLKG